MTRAIRVGDLVQDAQGQVSVVSVGRTWEAMAEDADPALRGCT